LFEKYMAAYLMRFLDRMDYPKAVYNARSCDRVICVMQEAHTHIDRVQDESFKATIADEMEKHYKILERLQLNEHCELDDESFLDAMRFLCPPKFPAVKEPVNSLSSLSALEQSRRLALKNLNFSDIVSLKYNGRKQDLLVANEAT
jgi:hypothetical protein